MTHPPRLAPRWWQRLLLPLAACSLALGLAPRYAGAAVNGTYYVHVQPHFRLLGKLQPHARIVATNGPHATLSSCTFPGATTPIPGFTCYSPQQIGTAYGIPYYNGNTAADGAGQTIVIVDAYGSPTISQDLLFFDSTYTLPDPAFHIIYPEGVPSFFQADKGTAAGWAFETTLDVEWAHAVAPGAAIELVIAKSSSGSDLSDAIRFAVTHHLGNIISLSFGEPENLIPGGAASAIVQEDVQTAQMAAASGITILASAGDQGANDYGIPGETGLQVVGQEPADIPNITAVTGTDLFIDDASSAYVGETVWNDGDPLTCPFGCTSGLLSAATGGAPSAFFAAPAYQQALSHNPMRIGADVAYNAGVYTGITIVMSTSDGGLLPFGTYEFAIGGTSAGAPQWAGIMALVDQARAGASKLPLGAANPALYSLAANPTTYANDFHDITVGQNGLSGPGFSAGTGYDIASGIGSPNVANLLTDLTNY